ncbi:MAG: hypothetical protein NWE99_01250 [Candidatus Bathyarchaeota archaeon]|nr:hypothetical protein [Candidatus Bathyarchaeota archaeon]
MSLERKQMEHDGILRLKFLLHLDDFMFFANGEELISLHLLRKCPLELCNWLSDELAGFMATVGAHFFDFYKIDLTKTPSFRRVRESSCDSLRCI